MGIRNPSRVREAMAWIIARLRGAGVTPLMLILPVIHDKKLIRSPARDLYLSIAEANGVHFLDVAALMLQAQEQGLAADVWMDDPVHIGSGLAGIVARWVRLAVDRLLATPAEFGIAQGLVRSYRLIRAADSVSTELQIERSSSLLSARLAKLNTEAPMRLNIGKMSIWTAS